MTASGPRLEPGTVVQLKTDKNGHPWTIKETRPNGTIKIVKNGKPENMYNTMHVTPSRLQKVPAQR